MVLRIPVEIFRSDDGGQGFALEARLAKANVGDITVTEAVVQRILAE